MNVFDTLYMKHYAYFLTEDINMDPFYYVNKKNISDNKNLQQASASYYDLMMTVGVVGIFLTISIFGLLYLSSNREKRAEAKQAFMIKGGIACLFFAFITILGLIFDITSLS